MYTTFAHKCLISDMNIVMVIIMDMDMDAIGLMDMGIAMVSCMG